MQASSRERRRIARQKQIISVASELFLAKGYDCTTMSAIAAELGGSKSTLWHHFPSKEALLTAVIEEAAAAMPRQLDLPRPPIDPLPALTRLCRSLVNCAISPTGVAICHLLGAPLAHRQEAISTGRAFEIGPATVLNEVRKWLEENFRSVLGSIDYEAASIDLFSLSTSDIFLRIFWGVSAGISEGQKEAWSGRAAQLFLSTYGCNPSPASASTVNAGYIS